MTSRGVRYWSAGSIPLIGPEILGDIIASVSDLALVLDSGGMILSALANAHHPSHGRIEHWENRDIRDFLTVESIPKLNDQLDRIQIGDVHWPIELNHSDTAIWEFPVRYNLHRISPDGTILLLGRDLRQIAEIQQQLVSAQIALEKDYEAQRDYDTRYRVLMDASRDAIVFVNLSNGRITDANNSAANLLGISRVDLIGNAFAQEFEGRRRTEFLDNLASAALSDQGRPLTLETRRSSKHVTIIPSLFRASGERLLLCRIEPMAADGAASDELTDNLTALYQDGADAIIFTDKDGVIHAANESFLNLADVTHASNIKGKPLSQYLVRGSVDTKVLLENAAKAGRMRLYSTKMEGDYGNQISVEISVTYLNDRAHPVYVFVIRDASRTEALRKPTTPVNDDAARSVMELVGSTTLKD
ncbi:MAG: transcriptional regulator PpsR, partial [Pseudomonadota bacterium]